MGKMKDKYKYIAFEEIVSIGKTKKFGCYNISDRVLLGEVKWYSSWRQYCFFPNAGLVFSKGCLDDISHFLNLIKNIRN